MQFPPFSIVFDLDGTLVDTAPDLAGALNAALTAAGRPEVPVSTVRHLVGRGARVLIEEGFKATGEPVAPEAIGPHVDIFLAHYGANLTANSRPFAGAREAAEALAAAGHGLAVCTNKPHDLAVRVMADLGLDDLFPVILGAGALPHRKPDPRHLLACIDRLGGSPSRAVLVGDSETDVATARAAGVPVVVVDWGYTPIAPQALGGDVLISTFHALEAALQPFVGRTGP